MMKNCINHEDHAAIEHCEVCGDALCDVCLWYDDDGRRLCENHAREYEEAGGSVQSPAFYVEGIHVKEGINTAPRAPYEGNQTDLIALSAGILGAASLMTWFGGGLCISFGAGILGVIALTSKKKGLNHNRVQQMGIFGLSLGVLGLVPIILFFCFFAFAFGLAFSGNAGP
jgi:hypothetical protein